MSRSDVPTSHTNVDTTATPAADAAAPESSSTAGLVVQAQPTPGSDAGERFAAWVLRGPLLVVLAGLALIQLGTWIPHYLTWPYWADHDVFATIAQGWDDGLLPYRDLRCNNFPGTIYLFWGLGKVFGWGRTMPLYAVDAALVVGLGAMLLVWSRRRLGGFVPGLVGYLSFLSYYLGLDYAHAAQRDWHGPCFAVISLLTAQTWPTRGGRFGSALAMALALSIRPQTVLFLPALALALDETRRPAGASIGVTIREWSIWGVQFSLLLALAFVPLVLAGVVGDFVQGVRLTAYGNAYNRATPSTILFGWFNLIAPLRTSVIPLVMGLLAVRAESRSRRLALVWIAAFAFGSLYKPLSPLAHSYLNIPLMLIWSVSLAVLVHLAMLATRQAPSMQLTATLIVLALGVTIRPGFCQVGPTINAVASFGHGKWPTGMPPGYRLGTVPTSGVYPWEDYEALIEHLKSRTTPDTRLANLLKSDPAVTAPAARHSVFPAESMAWLRLLCPEQQDDFAEILARTPNSVVVWIPGEVGPDPEFKLDQLTATVRQHYVPDARFGKLEVWRRKDTAAKVGKSKSAVRTSHRVDPAPTGAARSTGS